MKKLSLLILVLVTFSMGFAQVNPDRTPNYRKTKFNWPEGTWLNASEDYEPFNYKDKLILLHFWDPSCGAGRLTLEQLEGYHRSEPRVLPVTIIRTDREKEREPKVVSKHLKSLGITHPVYITADTNFFNKYNILQNSQVVIYNSLGQLLRNFDQILLMRHENFLDQFVTEYLEDNELSNIRVRTEPYDQTLLAHPIIDNPVDLAYDNSRDLLYVCDSKANRVLVFNQFGEFNTVVGGAKNNSTNNLQNVSFNKPQSIAVDEDSGLLYVADTYNHDIKVVDLVAQSVGLFDFERALKSAQMLAKEKDKMQAPFYPTHLEVVNNSLFVSFSGSSKLLKVSLIDDGAILYELEPLNYSYLNVNNRVPADITAMASDPAGNLYLMESFKNELWMLSPDSAVVPVVLARSDRNSPKNLWDYAQGMEWTPEGLMISDSYNHRILRFSTSDQNCSTWVGEGLPGYTMGSKGKGKFNHPEALTASQKEVYVVDSHNGMIRKVSLNAKKKLLTLSLSGIKNLEAVIDNTNNLDALITEEVNLGDYSPTTFKVIFDLPSSLEIDTTGNWGLDFGPNMEHFELVEFDAQTASATFELRPTETDQAMMFFCLMVLQRKTDNQIKYSVAAQVSVSFVYDKNKEKFTEWHIPVKRL